MGSRTNDSPSDDTLVADLRNTTKRYQIVRYLYSQKQPVTMATLAKRTRMTLGAAIYHSAKLQKWGVITLEKAGKTFARITDRGRAIYEQLLSGGEE